MHCLRAAVVIALAAAMVGCGRGDPNEEIRTLLAAAETAAEERDAGFFRTLIAPAYRDARGNDRDALLNLIRGYLLVHSNIEIILLTDEIVLHGEDAARVVVRAGMVGRRPGAALLGMDADLYRIELELIDDGSDWRVIGASWQPVGER